jgi:sensor histidine kinase regulating citrate/malate metabolism
MTVIPPLGSMMLLTGFATEASALLEMGINIYRQGLLFGFFLTALNLLTFYMSIRLLAFYEAQLQTQALEGQLSAYARRITAIETFQKYTEETRHEFKNLLFSMNVDLEQQNYERVKQRTTELLGEYQTAEPEHYTGNSLIDAVISYKAVRLRELGADLAVEADLPEDLESPLSYDIAAIMGISLDNVTDACEALRAADQTARPPVQCAIQKQKDLLLQIQIRNPLPAPLRYKNGEIQSTKTLSGHGLGLSALRRIAGKYGGDLTITDTGGTFTLTVMLFR